MEKSNSDSERSSFGAIGADKTGMVRPRELHNDTPTGWAIVAGSADTLDALLANGAAVMGWQVKDAQAGLNGEFRAYKVTPRENYERIVKRLASV